MILVRDTKDCAMTKRAAQAEVEFHLPGRQPLPRGGRQRLQLGVVVRRAAVLKVPQRSGGPGELHLWASTDPGVTVVIKRWMASLAWS